MVLPISMNRNDLLSDQMSTDVVVIGSGPGGAVASTVCAENGRSVLLLEEGENLPLESAPHFSREEILQKYRNAGITVAFGGAKIAYVEGRCVGGGSEINRGLYHRIAPDTLERWRSRFDVSGLSPDEMVPHFLECEKTARVEYLPGNAPPMSMRLHQGAKNLGWNSLEVPRLYSYGGVGRAGRKQSMSETFIPRFQAAGGRLISNTFVSRINRSGGKWRVSAMHAPKGQTSRQIEVSANEVIVACGAVQTPALLRRSGITKNVGNSLRFHPMVKVVALFDDEVNLPGELDPVHQVKEFEPQFSMGCSVSNRPALALALAAHPDHVEEVNRNWRRMAIYYVQNMGGCGIIRNLPFFRDPFVSVKQSAADLTQLATGLKRLLEVIFAAGATTAYPCVTGYPVLHSAGEIAQLPEALTPAHSNLTSVHVFSSCPMGENKALSAVDSYGRVHDVDHLYVADASVLCGPTVVNPQGTVMAVAHRNVQEAVKRRFK
jgi:choline dehydrogenase-like flavoprotein